MIKNKKIKGQKKWYGKKEIENDKEYIHFASSGVQKFL